MNYDHIHRFFLRTMAHRGVLSMSESLKVLEKFTGQDKSENDILKLVREINEEISAFKQRINIVNDKNTEICEKLLIFTNLVVDMATKAQKIFKEKECTYFTKLIRDIIESKSRHIKYKDVIDNMKKSLNSKREEVLIDRWCKLSYLKIINEDNNVYITLGLRGIHEFETYITENLKKFVENCLICKKIVIMRCHCTECDKVLHKQCLDIHMKNRHQHNITTSDDDSEEQLDSSTVNSSSISTDKENDLLNSDNEYVPRKRMRMGTYSTDS